MYSAERKYIFGPLLAGLGAGFGIKNNMIFQFTALGGGIGIIIDFIIVKIMTHNNML